MNAVKRWTEFANDWETRGSSPPAIPHSEVSYELSPLQSRKLVTARAAAVAYLSRHEW